MKALILVCETEIRYELEKLGNHDLLQFRTYGFYEKLRAIPVDITYDDLVRLKLKSIKSERKIYLKEHGRKVGNRCKSKSKSTL